MNSVSDNQEGIDRLSLILASHPPTSAQRVFLETEGISYSLGTIHSKFSNVSHTTSGNVMGDVTDVTTEIAEKP